MKIQRPVLARQSRLQRTETGGFGEIQTAELGLREQRSGPVWQEHHDSSRADFAGGWSNIDPLLFQEQRQGGAAAEAGAE